MDTQRDKGQYFTPTEIVQEIITCLSAYILKFPDSIKILEPALGEGVFCQEILNLYRKKFRRIEIDALDIDPVVIKKAKARLMPIVKHTSHSISIHKKNFLTEWDIESNREIYHCIIGNPPHNAKYEKKEWELITSQENDWLLPEKIPKESSLFFLLKGLALLKSGGIISFILPKPFTYSNRWKAFRDLCYNRYRLLEVYDLSNQFSGQLQEQVLVIIQKLTINESYITGIWNSSINQLLKISTVKLNTAKQLDNFLLGITKREQKLIDKLRSRCRMFDWNAFRGLSSIYRTQEENIPLIEKSTITNGFLLPSRNFVGKEVPEKLMKRIRQSKIILQRIITYQTQPSFALKIPVFIDKTGELVTHETVTNIISPNKVEFDLYSYGGLFRSTIIAWWLQHAVYTKIFCTSKDLDKPYLNKIVFPIIEGEINPIFRERVIKQCEKENYYQICKLTKIESKTDQFYTIGELFKNYLQKGSQIKENLIEFLPDSKNINSQESYYLLNRLNNLFISNNKEKIEKHFKNSELIIKKPLIDQISEYYKKLKIIQEVIDEIAFHLYDLTSNEREMVMEGRRT
jgi:hypothetical protein